MYSYPSRTSKKLCTIKYIFNEISDLCNVKHVELHGVTDRSKVCKQAYVKKKLGYLSVK